MVSLFSEIVIAGTDTTSVPLQWSMANLVKYPHNQEKLYMGIKEVVVHHVEEEIKEDLQNMPYLKSNNSWRVEGGTQFCFPSTYLCSQGNKAHLIKILGAYIAIQFVFIFSFFRTKILNFKTKILLFPELNCITECRNIYSKK